MSRKRSRYRPRPVISDPLSLLRPASAAQRDKVEARFRTALDAMTYRKAPSPEEWRDLSDAINTVETLALHLGKLVPEEVMPAVNDAVAGMARAAQRYRQGKAMRLDGPGKAGVIQVIEFYCQCMENLTEREMAQAQAETQRRVHALLRQRAPSTQVIAL